MLVLRVFFFIPSSHKLALALKLKQPWRVDQVHQDFGPVAHVVSGQISGVYQEIRKSSSFPGEASPQVSFRVLEPLNRTERLHKFPN